MASHNYDIPLMSKSMSELIGGYDVSLKIRAEQDLLGETEYECYMRFVEDLEKSKDPGSEFYFDKTEVKRVLEFASLLTVYDGKGNASGLQLYPIQKFIVANLYGWRSRETDCLRYRESYISFGRRNGKSFITSVLLHYFATGSSYRSERGICFSIKKDSAMIAFRQFGSFIDADPDLEELYNYSANNGTAESKGTKNRVEVFSGAKDADGYQSGYAISDEIALQDGQLYQLILDGQSNLPQSQCIGISTAGFKLGGWCHKRYKAIKTGLKAKNLSDTLFVCICEIDDDDDYGDWHAWCRANPVLFFDQKTRLKKAQISVYTEKYMNAVQQGGLQMNSWITKQLNHWNAAPDSLLCNFNELSNSRFDFSFADVAKKYKTWYLGVDLAQVADLNSVAWLTWIYEKDGKLVDPNTIDAHQRLYINVISYMPSATLTNHIITDKVDYKRYINTELILTTGGKGLRTDYAEILEDIKKTMRMHNLNMKTIACDPYGVGTIQSGLDDICETLILQSQNRKALSPYIETFAALVNSSEIALSDKTCDLFIKAVTGAVVETADDGYLQVTKPNNDAKAPVRIDPVDAVIDGLIAPVIDRNNDTISAEEVIELWADLYK